jgi:hypothetical protein
VPRGRLASVLAALLFIAVGRSGASCVCRSAAEGAGTCVNNGNVSNLQGAIELEENVSPSFRTTYGLRWWFLRWWLLLWCKEPLSSKRMSPRASERPAGSAGGSSVGGSSTGGSSAGGSSAGGASR